jgi:hypothetical protein
MKFVVDASPLFHIPLISRMRRLPALSFATPVDSLSLPVAPTESHTHEGSCGDGSMLVGRERMHRTFFFDADTRRMKVPARLSGSGRGGGLGLFCGMQAEFEDKEWKSCVTRQLQSAGKAYPRLGDG